MTIGYPNNFSNLFVNLFIVSDLNVIFIENLKKARKYTTKIIKKNYENNKKALWLPQEIWDDILFMVNLEDLGNLLKTSKYFKTLISDKVIERIVFVDVLENKKYLRNNLLRNMILKKSTYWIKRISSVVKLEYTKNKFCMNKEEVSIFIETIINNDLTFLKFILFTSEIGGIRLDIMLEVLLKYKLFDSVKYIITLATQFGVGIDHINNNSQESCEIMVDPLIIPLLLGKYEICEYMLKFIYDAIETLNTSYEFKEELFTVTKRNNSVQELSPEDLHEYCYDGYYEVESEKFGSLENFLKSMAQNNPKDKLYSLYIQINERSKEIKEHKEKNQINLWFWDFLKI